MQEPRNLIGFNIESCMRLLRLLVWCWEKAESSRIEEGKCATTFMLVIT